MAIDFNAVKILFWAKNLGASFEKTITLGHLGFFCSPRRFRRAVRDFSLAGTREQIDRCFQHPPFRELFADELFRFLGAEEVVSVDRSDFEGANLLHDLNEPFPDNHRGHYSFVCDGGTLEHVFNYPAALRHCMELVRPGGHFLTIPPAHNAMGHGFYQISPELLFRVFSAENGFVLRKIILFDLKADAVFFQVNDPAVTGIRTSLVSKRPLLLAALAQRTAPTPIFARTPQQSDYAAQWETFRENPEITGPNLTGPVGRLRAALNPFWPYWLRSWKHSLVGSLGRGSPKLTNRRHFQKLDYWQICRERLDSAS